MGDACLHGIGTSFGACQCGVTHVPGLKCYLCLRTVPTGGLTAGLSGPARRRPLSLIVGQTKAVRLQWRLERPISVWRNAVNPDPEGWSRDR